MTKYEQIELLKQALEVRGLGEKAYDAFTSMLEEFEREERQTLSPKQLTWVKNVVGVPEYENLVSEGRVPRGKEVPPPPALQNLPKKPPRLPTSG